MIKPPISIMGKVAQAENKYIVENLLPKSFLPHICFIAVGHKDKNPDIDEP